MLERRRCQQPTARGTLQEAFLDQERLDDVFDGIARLRQRGRQGVDTHRSSAIILADGLEIAVVHGVQPGAVHFQRQERPVGGLAVDGLGAVDQREVAHTAQQPARDPRRAAGTTRDLVGAVRTHADAEHTRAGLLTNPLRDRFGIPVRLNFYSEKELEEIVNRGARVLKIGMTPDGANEIARRARGTPRIAGRLLRRVRDFASAADAASIDRAIADNALGALEVDAAGLDAMDRRYLTTIAMNYGGGPVGVETMAAALSEPRDAIEDIIEPFLIQCGYLQRTPRGRLLTSHAFRHLGLAEPARDPAQFGLFGNGSDD